MRDDVRRYLKVVVYIFVIIIVICLMIQYQGIGREAVRELAALDKPPNARLATKTSNAAQQFEIYEHKDNIKLYYDKELKRNGWEFAYEGGIAEFKGKHQTGRQKQYVVYTKERLKLAVVWVPDASGMVGEYALEISEKEMAK